MNPCCTSEIPEALNVSVGVPVQRWLPGRADRAGLGGAGVPRSLLRCCGKPGSPAAQGVPARARRLNLTCISTRLCQTNVFLFRKVSCGLVYGTPLIRYCTGHHLLCQLSWKSNYASKFSVCEENLVHMPKKYLLYWAVTVSSVSPKITTGHRNTPFCLLFLPCAAIEVGCIFLLTLYFKGL